MTSLKGKYEFEVRWLPFQLNANASRSGVNKMQMYMEKFGRTREQMDGMMGGMKATFSGVGLPFNFTDKGLTANTFNAHRIMSYTYDKLGAAAQDKVAESLFNSYFNLELSPNDPQVLLEAAQTSGLPAEEVAKLLEDESFYAVETAAELEYGKKMRVNGVPFFVLQEDGTQKKLSVSGAQPQEAFVEAIQDLLS